MMHLGNMVFHKRRNQVFLGFLILWDFFIGGLIKKYLKSENPHRACVNPEIC